jgi:superfamily II DNA or RNA helicase
MPTVELSTNLLAEIGGWPALKEARAMVERGRVHDARREGDIIRARIQGAEKTNDAQITLADRVANVEVRCTCAESRRTGRVCAHALAAGLALLQPAKSPAPRVARTTRCPGDAAPAAAQEAAPESTPKLIRFPFEEAPAGTPPVELTILLPLNLAEALARDPIRVILESNAQPLDPILRQHPGGIAVSEADDRILTALEQLTGTASGLNAIPRARIANFLRALDNHPRIWLGKKQRLEIHATTDRPQIHLSRQPDGSLQLVAAAVPSGGSAASAVDAGRVRENLKGGSAAPSLGTATAISEVLPRWRFDGTHLTETPALPANFSSAQRTIPHDKIPDFLTREFPSLERTCEIIFAPGTEEFRLEIAPPTFEARLEGALSGLTLDLIAHYGDTTFPLTREAEPKAYATYFPTQKNPVNSVHSVNSVKNSSVFWRRNITAERAALAQVTAAGFSLIRAGATSFSLISENHVARFLANTLPRWRRAWTVTHGPRLEATLAEVDIAQPEFSLKGSAGNDWLGLDLQLSVGGKPIALDQAEIQRWLQTGQSHTRTASKRVLLVPTEAWSEMKEILADCEIDQEPGQVRVGKTFAPYLTGALAAQGFRNVEAGREPIHALAGADTLKAALDEKLLAQLRPYQAHGVEWLARLAQQNFHGLLADDMGLGKTLQALAFAAWLKGNLELRTKNLERADEDTFDRSKFYDLSSKFGPSLIVCPTSLVTNWQREAARFTPHLRTLDLTGPDRAEKFAQRRNYDLLITSYAVLRRDIELYRAEEFSLVILDEAQHIKNRGSQNAQSAKALRARHRLILTGTPLENSVLDLWSLFDFLLPGYLGTAAEFRERYETPLAKDPQPKLMERLRHRTRPFFLRRTKEEVLTELPPKLEYPTLCALTDEQREVYRAVLAQGRREVFDHSDKAGRKSGRDRLAVLTTLLRLRQVCCHLDLLPHGDEKRAWKEPSAKMDRTFDLIDEAIDGGHRILLFSQFVRVLHLLRDEATRRDLRFCYLDGQTVERQAEVDRFQADAGIPLFFISLKAGGTGLNLTGADTVIHFDPWWNPAVEEQATSRAHRMGQARSVQAYKLIAAGTVEEKIQALQARKRELFTASLSSDEAFVDKLTGDDLEELLSE